ncbi:MAG: hypothetical protein FWE09_08745 [Treponema sp.]|nr:hypothetical protein [Treponema sp.]
MDERPTRWIEGIVFRAGAGQFIAPNLISEHVRMLLGFKGSLGYRFQRLSIEAESGVSRIEGINPLVVDATLVPLLLRAGYAQPLFGGLSIQAEAMGGYVFSTVSHYPAVLDWLMERLLVSKARTPTAGIRASLALDLFDGILRLSAGGGVDALFENDGSLILPVMEAGITLRPFRARFVAPAPEMAASPLIASAPAIAPEAVLREARDVLVVNFWPDSALMLPGGEAAILAAAAILGESPDDVVILRAYAAQHGTEAGRDALSSERAALVAALLAQALPGAADRMRVEIIGARDAPEDSDRSDEARRAVEIIIERIVALGD